MTENPYQSPASVDESLLSSTEQRERAASVVRTPAKIIVVLCMVAILLYLSIIGYVACIAFNAGANVPGMAGRFHIAFGPHLLLIAIHVLTIYGAMSMLKLRSLAVARAAMTLACVPFLSPMLVVGIPFAIWGLIVLCLPYVTAEFRAGQSLSC
jgi:hypothetical protein